MLPSGGIITLDILQSLVCVPNQFDPIIQVGRVLVIRGDPQLGSKLVEQRQVNQS